MRWISVRVIGAIAAWISARSFNELIASRRAVSTLDLVPDDRPVVCTIASWPHKFNARGCDAGMNFHRLSHAARTPNGAGQQHGHATPDCDISAGQIMEETEQWRCGADGDLIQCHRGAESQAEAFGRRDLGDKCHPRSIPTQAAEPQPRSNSDQCPQ